MGRLVPATIVLLPTLAVVTITAGVTMALPFETVWPMTTLSGPYSCRLGIACTHCSSAPTAFSSTASFGARTPTPSALFPSALERDTAHRPGGTAGDELFLMLRVAAMAT